MGYFPLSVSIKITSSIMDRFNNNDKIEIIDT